MSDPEENKKRWGLTNSFDAFRDAGPLFGLGIQMAAAVVVMFFLGRWLDDKWGTAPWMMLIGALLGAAGGLYSFIRTAVKISNSDSEKSKSTK